MNMVAGTMSNMHNIMGGDTAVGSGGNESLYWTGNLDFFSSEEDVSGNEKDAIQVRFT